MQPFNSGVPQSSVLSYYLIIWLFLIFTYDLAQSDNTHLTSFADVICVLAKHEDSKKLMDILEMYMNNLED